MTEYVNRVFRLLHDASALSPAGDAEQLKQTSRRERQ